MKITNVETLILRYPQAAPGEGRADAQHRFGGGAGVAIRLQSDVGVTGHGYVGLGVAAPAAKAIQALIEGLFAPVILGEDPFYPRRLRDRLWHEVEYVGVEGIAHFALTALDATFWDMMARALRVPGWQLLGACCDRIPAYAMVGWYYDDDEALDKFKRAIEVALADGMAGIKIKVGRGPLEEDVRRIEVARSLVGQEGILMVDANQVLNRNEALRRGRVYEELGCYWFEEPLRPHDKEGYARLCAELDIPVATGENEYAKYHVQELIRLNACDILQPDCRRTGGPSEWMEIAGLAAACHIPIASHGGDGVTTHLLMATPTAIWCETGGKPKGPGLFVDRARIEGGYVYAPEAIGFGMELREEVIERYGVRK
ncbi:MAG: mandelate racemase/muconate lactonizing enzyme family protein [Chloroflexi bacterium]|nr:mandelate racemase/muconate lactonizing enzyme family protein [Chloroflexota bacterium]